MDTVKLRRRIRRMILFFILALVLSGLTAMPVYTELSWLLKSAGPRGSLPFREWLERVYNGVSIMNDRFPFLMYGYDWLAFAHLVIAMAFIGPYRDPVRNSWVIEWAMLACVAVFPLALIAGPIRGIPWYHIVIDCCFGIFGLVPLALVRNLIRKLEMAAKTTTA